MMALAADDELFLSSFPLVFRPAVRSSSNSTGSIRCGLQLLVSSPKIYDKLYNKFTTYRTTELERYK